MNYYEHHLGDYAEATGHLSFIEDAAYSRLLRKYYATERPLPCNVTAVTRIVAARTDEERAAVEAVLKEFFELREDGWHNKRCDEEIAHYRAGEPDRELRRSNEAERVRKHREERRKLFKCLNSAGEHPAFNSPTALLRSLHEQHCNGTCNAAVTDVTRTATLHVTRTATGPDTPATALQTPVSSTQYPVPSTQTPSSHTECARDASREGKASDQPTPNAYGAMSIALRNAGVNITSIHPVLVAWVDDGFTVDQVLGALAKARETKGDNERISAAYLDPIVRAPPRMNGSPSRARVSGSGEARTHAQVMAALDALPPCDEPEFPEDVHP